MGSFWLHGQGSPRQIESRCWRTRASAPREPGLEHSLLRPQLLFGNQALHELGPFLLIGLDTLVQ